MVYRLAQAESKPQTGNPTDHRALGLGSRKPPKLKLHSRTSCVLNTYVRV